MVEGKVGQLSALIGGIEVSPESSERGGVTPEMMKREDERGWLTVHIRRSNEWTVVEIEGFSGLRGSQVGHRPMGDRAPGKCVGGGQHASWQREGSAQGVMTSDHREKGRPESLGIDRCRQPVLPGDAEPRTVGVAASLEQQSLLARRQAVGVGGGRNGSSSVRTAERRTARRTGQREGHGHTVVGRRGDLGIDQARQLPHGAGLERDRFRQAKGQEGRQPGHHVERGQGVSPDVEEVVIDSDPLETQNLAPELAERHLEGTVRGRILPADPVETGGRGQRREVDLGAPRQRECLDVHEGAR